MNMLTKEMQKFSPVMLHHHMKQRGLTPHSLSEKSGVNPRQIYRYLKGEQKPRKPKVTQLSHCLELEPSALWATHETDYLRDSHAKSLSKWASSDASDTLDFTYNDIKTVFFDLDGTLAKPRIGDQTSWELIWHHLGYDVSICKKLHGKFTRLEIGHQEWCDITCNYFRNRHLTVDMFEEIATQAPLIDDVRETLSKIRDAGITIGLISGSIDSYLKAVFPDYSDYFDNEEVWINLFEYERNAQGYLKKIYSTPYDFKGKAKRVLEHCKENSLNVDEVMFVGNSTNDIIVPRTKAISVALNPVRIEPSHFHEVKHSNSLSVISKLLGL